MNWRSIGISAAVGLLVGLALGWCWYRPHTPGREPPAASYAQRDGSVVVARVDPPTQPTKPPHELPRGSREERRVSVVVKPGPGRVVHDTVQVPAPDHVSQPGKMVDSIMEHCECPPVQVDLSLVRMPDKTRRVIASSPDGKILSGVDVPLEVASAPKIPAWTISAVAEMDANGIRPGAFLQRRLGPFVAGGGAFVDPGLRRPGAIVTFGVTF